MHGACAIVNNCGSIKELFRASQAFAIDKLAKNSSVHNLERIIAMILSVDCFRKRWTLLMDDFSH